MTTDDVNRPAPATPQGAGRVVGDVDAADITQQAWWLNLKEGKQQCYCCGHVNPNAAYECEKCYVGL